jgi:hypothetical protein
MALPRQVDYAVRKKKLAYFASMNNKQKKNINVNKLERLALLIASILV